MTFKQKKGVSLIVSYVLLIIIGLSFSVLVYNWLRFRTSYSPEEKCPEEVSLIIKEYDCDMTPNVFSLIIQNKGTFSVDGYVIRVHTDPNAEIGVYPLPSDSSSGGRHEDALSPGEDTGMLSFANTNGWLKFIEIQPFIIKKKGSKVEYLYCEQVLKQKLNCGG